MSACACACVESSVSFFCVRPFVFSEVIQHGQFSACRLCVCVCVCVYVYSLYTAS